jgi:hypothetical protein
MLQIQTTSKLTASLQNEIVTCRGLAVNGSTFEDETEI